MMVSYFKFRLKRDHVLLKSSVKEKFNDYKKAPTSTFFFLICIFDQKYRGLFFYVSMVSKNSTLLRCIQQVVSSLNHKPSFLR